MSVFFVNVIFRKNCYADFFILVCMCMCMCICYFLEVARQLQFCKIPKYRPTFGVAWSN